MNDFRQLLSIELNMCIKLCIIFNTACALFGTVGAICGLLTLVAIVSAALWVSVNKDGCTAYFRINETNHLLALAISMILVANILMKVFGECS